MNHNSKWSVFLIVMAIIAFGFSVKAAYLSYETIKLNNAAPALIHQWSVKPLTNEQYQIHADYTFFLKNISYAGKTTFGKPLYRNPYAAQKAIKSLASQEWKSWYDRANPHHSSLEKTFPLKDWIYAGILWGLFFYFVWLGRYTFRLKNYHKYTKK